MPRTGETIVLIDDDPSVRQALGRFLRSARLAVEAFASAEEFLQAPSTPEPACLVVDVRLPGLSGPELLRQLRERGCRVPAVFITADTDPEARREAVQAGGIVCLQKPFDGQALLDALESAVGGGGCG